MGAGIPPRPFSQGGEGISVYALAQLISGCTKVDFVKQEDFDKAAELIVRQFGQEPQAKYKAFYSSNPHSATEDIAKRIQTTEERIRIHGTNKPLSEFGEWLVPYDSFLTLGESLERYRSIEKALVREMNRGYSDHAQSKAKPKTDHGMEDIHEVHVDQSPGPLSAKVTGSRRAMLTGAAWRG